MKEILKIAFVGTSCIGKTALLNTCRKNLGSNNLFVEEAARDWFAAHPDVTDRFSVKTQGQIQALALEREREAHARTLTAPHLGRLSVITTDRSVLDAPVYVHAQGDESGAAELLDRVRLWVPTYDKLYLLDPADIPYEPDKIRTEGEATRQLFHDNFVGFFGANDIPYELLSGTIEERFRQVNGFIAQQWTSGV